MSTILDCSKQNDWYVTHFTASKKVASSVLPGLHHMAMTTRLYIYPTYTHPFKNVLKNIHLKKIYNTEWLITSNVCAMEKSNLCSGKHHCGQTSKCTNFFHSWRLLFEGHECKNEHWQHRKVKCNISVSRCNRHMPLLTPRILFCFNISRYVIG